MLMQSFQNKCKYVNSLLYENSEINKIYTDTDDLIFLRATAEQQVTPKLRGALISFFFIRDSSRIEHRLAIQPALTAKVRPPIDQEESGPHRYDRCDACLTSLVLVCNSP